jgi:serine/threonine protein kinase
MGFTQDPISMQYYFITSYAENGDLRKYLHENPNLSWEDRLYIVWDISLDLERIHKAGLIHRDIHAGNILHTGEVAHFVDEIRVHNGVAYIADFGFSMAASYSNNSAEEVYGVMPYIAPEVLNGMDYSMESDIYSIGIIMWEIASGKSPFADVSHDSSLALDIYDGLRPEPTPNAPPVYLQLMQRCWHKDPSKRPKAVEINEMINELWESDQVKMQFANKIDNNKIAPNAIHKSRLIPTITSLLSKRNSSKLN